MPANNSDSELRERCIQYTLQFLGDVQEAMTASSQGPWIPQSGWIGDFSEGLYQYIVNGSQLTLDKT